MNKMLSIWLDGAIILTIAFGTIYATVQQSLRHGADDPQTQMAEDTAKTLEIGVDPKNLVKGVVDGEASLAPFTIIYDHDEKVLASSVLLDGKTPELPQGVLKSTSSGDQNHVTWQPRKDVRIAAVLVATENNYVLSGRSLREVEKRELQTQLLAGLGWVLSLAVLTATLFLTKLPHRK